MNIKLAQSCLGFPLLVGVEVACLATLCVSVLLIAICSSTEPLEVSSLVIPPWVQVGAASWAFVGIPCSIAAGVGVLHRIEQAVRVFFVFQVVSFCLSLIIPVWFFFTNSLCDVVVHPDLQSQGTAFVCGFANTFIVIWGLMGVMVQIYFLFIIYSAAGDIGENPYPELYRYEDALRSANLPPVRDEERLTPEMLSKAAWGVPPVRGGEEGARAGAAAPQAGQQKRGSVSALLSQAAADGQAYRFGPAADEGTPQSFIPSPPSGVRFSQGSL